MKKLVLSLVALASLNALAELKIGTVDLMLLIRNHPNYESNKQLLTSTDKDYQKKLDVIKAEGEKLQEEGKALADQLRNPMLVAKAKAEAEKKMMDLQQKLVTIDQRYRSEAMRCRQDLQDLEGRLLKTTTDDLRKRIKAVADKGGYDLIVDKAAAPFSKDGLDVSMAVLKQMGVSPDSVKKLDNEGK